MNWEHDKTKVYVTVQLYLLYMSLHSAAVLVCVYSSQCVCATDKCHTF